MTDFLPDLVGPWTASVALAVLGAFVADVVAPKFPPQRAVLGVLAVLLAAPLVVRLYLYAIGVLP